MRTKIVISVYLGALYLATPTGDAAAAIAADEPKRIVMHFVHSKVGAEAIREAWRDGFSANSAATLPQLKERLERFSGWFDADLLKGEQVVLTYLPGQGTEVTVQGQGARGDRGCRLHAGALVGLARGEAGGRRPQEGDVGKVTAAEKGPSAALRSSQLPATAPTVSVTRLSAPCTWTLLISLSVADNGEAHGGSAGGA